MLQRRSPTRRPDARVVVGAAVPLAAAALAMAVTTVVPLLSALLVALALGAVVVNLAPRAGRASQAVGGAEHAAKQMLRLGIVLLGLTLSLSDLAAIGWQGLLVVVATVGVTFVVTVRVGRRLGLDPGLATLIAAGFSICGAAAIAAVSQTVRAKPRDVGLAVSLVTIFGSAMIAVVPWLSHVIGLGEQDAATWAGASIHEVAQVVAAGSVLGGSALATATTVKLARVVMVAPVTAIVKRRHAGSGGAPVPWFVTGFLAAVVLRTLVDVPDPVLGVASVLSTLLLAAGMFGLGLAIRVRDLWPLPGRAFAAAGVATAAALTVPLVILLLT
ncbi:YeiH family protein [Pseudactinotalea sp.]|uniref:YeiH family protein n=1 Tax=Pseudactinotalea sp. TaxID=1926260 RepID=UPI003B3AD972